MVILNSCLLTGRYFKLATACYIQSKKKANQTVCDPETKSGLKRLALSAARMEMKIPQSRCADKKHSSGSGVTEQTDGAVIFCKQRGEELEWTAGTAASNNFYLIRKNFFLLEIQTQLYGTFSRDRLA